MDPVNTPQPSDPRYDSQHRPSSGDSLHQPTNSPAARWKALAPTIQTLIKADELELALDKIRVFQREHIEGNRESNSEQIASARLAAQVLLRMRNLDGAEAELRATLQNCSGGKLSNVKIDLVRLIISNSDRLDAGRTEEIRLLLSSARDGWATQRGELAETITESSKEAAVDLHEKCVRRLISVAALWKARGKIELYHEVLSEAANASLLWGHDLSNRIVDTRHLLAEQLLEAGSLETAYSLLRVSSRTTGEYADQDPRVLLENALLSRLFLHQGDSARASDIARCTLERATYDLSDTLRQVAVVCHHTLGLARRIQGAPHWYENLEEALTLEQQRQDQDIERAARISLELARGLNDQQQNEQSDVDCDLAMVMSAYDSVFERAQRVGDLHPALALEMLEDCIEFLAELRQWDVARNPAKVMYDLVSEIYGAHSEEALRTLRTQRVIYSHTGTDYAGKIEALFSEELALALRHTGTSPLEALQTYGDFAFFVCISGKTNYGKELAEDRIVYAQGRFGADSSEYAESLIDAIVLKSFNGRLSHEDRSRIVAARRILKRAAEGAQIAETFPAPSLLVARAEYARGCYLLDVKGESESGQKAARKAFYRARTEFRSTREEPSPRDLEMALRLQCDLGVSLLESYSTTKNPQKLRLAIQELRLGHKLAEEHGIPSSLTLLQKLLDALAENGQGDSEEAQRYRQIIGDTTEE
jgi:hypothetical protein